MSSLCYQNFCFLLFTTTPHTKKIKKKVSHLLLFRDVICSTAQKWMVRSQRCDCCCKTAQAVKVRRFHFVAAAAIAV